MITKEKFCKYVRELHEIVKDTDNAHKALGKLDPDFGGLHLGRHENMVVNLICELAEDLHKESWLAYWIYELDWGKKSKEYKVTCHGRNYTLSTPEQLYDFMIHKCKTD